MDDDYYYKPKGGRIPVKWTAPEAVLYKKYTTKSDVWSYGMVMYEIWSLGHKPFEDFKTEEVRRVMFLLCLGNERPVVPHTLLLWRTAFACSFLMHNPALLRLALSLSRKDANSHMKL